MAAGRKEGKKQNVKTSVAIQSPPNLEAWASHPFSVSQITHHPLSLSSSEMSYGNNFLPYLVKLGRRKC